jgi:nucleoside-diphosphate-sugar epimerase
LLEKGYRVKVYDNLMYKQLTLLEHCYNTDFEFVLGDVCDWGHLAKEVDTADIVIPLAAIVGAPACERNKKLTTDVNHMQMLAIKSNTVKSQKIIFPTTNSGYGVGEKGIFCDETTPLKPVSHYGKTKVDAEKLWLDSGRAVTFRLATVFGISPRMRLDLLVNDFTYRAVCDGYLVLFEEHFKRNYIHIRDVANTFLFAIDNYDKMVGQPFNVGLSSANISKRELAEKIKEYIPKLSIQSDNISEDPDKRNYIVSNAKLEGLGWAPEFTLDMGIQELIKAYKIILTNDNAKFTNL